AFQPATIASLTLSTSEAWDARRVRRSAGFTNTILPFGTVRAADSLATASSIVGSFLSRIWHSPRLLGRTVRRQMGCRSRGGVYSSGHKPLLTVQRSNLYGCPR